MCIRKVILKNATCVKRGSELYMNDNLILKGILNDKE